MFYFVYFASFVNLNLSLNQEMNSKNLIPPIKKQENGEDLPQVQSIVRQGGQGQTLNLSNSINSNIKMAPKNPQEFMKIPEDLSLVKPSGKSNEKNSEKPKEKHKIIQHLSYVKTQKDKEPEYDLGLSLSRIQRQPDREQKKNNAEAQEEFSKKFRRMYQFPASVSQALVHRRAYRNGFNSSSSIYFNPNKGTEPEKKDTLLCPCCQNFVNTIQVPLCYSTYPKKQYYTPPQRQKILAKVSQGKQKSENAFLFKGGDALFFCFIKLIITFLLLKCVILDAFNLYTNYMGTYCKSHHQAGKTYLCTNWYVSVFSTYNNATAEGQASFEYLDLMSLVMTIVSIFFCLYARIKLYELYWIVEKGNTTEDDYTILIQNIPPIPFMGNDSLVKDVNQQYRSFIKKLVSNKIKIWLNSFYSYQKDQDIEDKVDHEFYEKIFKKNKDNQSDLFENIVTQVSLCYDLTQLQNLQHFRQNLVQHFLQEEGDKQAMQNSLFDDEVSGENTNSFARQYIAYLPHQIEIINQHYVQLCERISDTIVLKVDPEKLKENASNKKPLTELKISRFVGKAFVSFQYQHYKHYLLHKFEENKDYFKVNGNTVRLTLSHAQKPNDVYWQNMKITEQFRKQQIRNSYILVLVALLMSSSIMYILRFIQSRIVNTSKEERTTLHLIILYSIPLWTFLVNYFLDWGIFQLTKSQKHKTQTEELSSLIVKNTTAKFINTSVIYALIFIFGEKVNAMKENGLVKTIFDLVYINALLNIATEFVQPGMIISNWKNKKYLAKPTVNVFQIKLNKMLEMPTFDFAQAYSYYLQMIYICSFYGYLLPAITPILLVAFSIQYWVDKFNLLKRCSSPIDMGYFLTKLTWISFEMSLVLYVLGHLVWSKYFYQTLKTTSIIYNYTNLGLAVGYVAFVSFFPELIQKFTRNYASQSGLSDQPYEEAYAKFQKTYRAQNPATSFLNQKEDQKPIPARESLAPNIQNILRSVANIGGIKVKTKLKSELFIPADSQINKPKLKQILEAGQQSTMKCQQDKDDEFQGYSTVLCCL